MNRAVWSRIAKLEAKSGRAGIVHVISAASDEDYQTRRDTLIRYGAHLEGVFIRVMSFRDEEPLSTGKTAGELFDDIAKRGWRIHNKPETRR